MPTADPQKLYAASRIAKQFKSFQPFDTAPSIRAWRYSGAYSGPTEFFSCVPNVQFVPTDKGAI